MHKRRSRGVQLLKTVPPVTTVTWLCICHTPSITPPPHLLQRSSGRPLTGGNNPAELVTTQKEKSRVCLLRPPPHPRALRQPIQDFCVSSSLSQVGWNSTATVFFLKLGLIAAGDDNTCDLEVKWKSGTLPAWLKNTNKPKQSCNDISEACPQTRNQLFSNTLWMFGLLRLTLWWGLQNDRNLLHSSVFAF